MTNKKFFFQFHFVVFELPELFEWQFVIFYRNDKKKLKSIIFFFKIQPNINQWNGISINFDFHHSIAFNNHQQHRSHRMTLHIPFNRINDDDY